MNSAPGRHRPQRHHFALRFKSNLLNLASVDTYWRREGETYYAVRAGRGDPTSPSLRRAGGEKDSTLRPAKNPIDAFVLARLEREQLAPAPEAPRASLFRRVSLDLTGLPPTPAEMDAFLADRRPDAYERVVDRLLASPRYGERWAWDWLDVARYADTNAFQGDPERTMWPWRDWVVNALNANMPYDQFTIEQLAGDLLPGATRGQKIASGFHRNNMFNGEGGRIAEETRVETSSTASRPPRPCGWAPRLPVAVATITNTIRLPSGTTRCTTPSTRCRRRGRPAEGRSRRCSILHRRGTPG